MSAFDLIAIDVDGTLLNTRHEISEGAAEAIAAASGQGILPVLVSGRSKLLLKPFLEALRTAPYYASSGGACVARDGGAVISLQCIDRPVAEQIVSVVRQRGMGLCFHNDLQMPCEVHSERFMSLIREITKSKTVFVQDILESSTTGPEKITVFGEPEQISELSDFLSGMNLNISMSVSGPLYLEVTRAGVSKGNALRILSEHLEIPLSRVVAIGDQQNDISMFQVAGLAVAMGNAPAEVQAAADIVAPSNDAGGLAWVLRQLVMDNLAV